MSYIEMFNLVAITLHVGFLVWKHLNLKPQNNKKYL